MSNAMHKCCKTKIYFLFIIAIGLAINLVLEVSDRV